LTTWWIATAGKQVHGAGGHFEFSEQVPGINHIIMVFSGTINMPLLKMDKYVYFHVLPLYLDISSG